MRDWLAPEEQALAAGDSTAANLVWTAKEAAAKVRREGLRLDVRSAVDAACRTADGGGLAAARGRLDARGLVTRGVVARRATAIVMLAASPRRRTRRRR